MRPPDFFAPSKDPHCGDLSSSHHGLDTEFSEAFHCFPHSEGKTWLLESKGRCPLSSMCFVLPCQCFQSLSGSKKVLGFRGDCTSHSVFGRADWDGFSTLSEEFLKSEKIFFLKKSNSLCLSTVNKTELSFTVRVSMLKS